MKLDLQTVISGMLHGVLKKDPSLSIKELESEYGKDVANIVRGATRITNVKFNSKLTYQAENIRKLLLAMASDIRVLLVKLADRLHDMRSFIYWMIESSKRNWPRKPWNFTHPLPAVWVSIG
jgi:GTP pyrophosphokinase